MDQSKQSFEGERRQATVMFAHIHGVNRISELMDPEEVNVITNECLQMMETLVGSIKNNVVLTHLS